MTQHKNIKAMTFSLTSLRRVLQASFGLSLLATTGLALLPQVALASDECTPTPASGTLGDGVNGASDPGLNGAAADSFDCTTTPFASGITYSSSGDLTVTKTNTGNTTITANGINLTGNGADNVTWNSAVGNITGGAGTAGPVIDVTTASGDISITTALVGGAQAGTTHGIRATSTGGGDIAITRSGSINNVAVDGQAAIEAVTAGGNISITATGTGFTNGRARGILAQTSGAGTISITSSATINANATDGIAAIDTIAGTGDTTITLTAGTVNGGPGAAIRSISGGGRLVVNLSGNATLTGRLDLAGVTGGVVISGIGGGGTGGGIWNATGSSSFTVASDDVSVQAGSLTAGGSIGFGAGADSFSVRRFDVTSAAIDFGTGADTFRVSGINNLFGDSGFNGTGTIVDMGADADRLVVTGSFIMSGGSLRLGTGEDVIEADNFFKVEGLTIDFGADVDTFNQSGSLIAAGIVKIDNLETFNNSGSIYLGGVRAFSEDLTDSRADDVLFVTGGTFTGSGSSRVVLDANLGSGQSQLDCSSPTVSDCVNFTGATTAGSTQVKVQDISFARNGGSFGSVVTLIEGATAAEHFTLDPDSLFFGSTPQGDAIRKTLVAYQFLYDPDTKRHVLLGAPTDEVYQMGTLAASAQETWRASTGNWLSRQADLRATPGGLKSSNGAWAKLAVSESERENGASYTASGVSLNYDLTHQQRTTNLLFGADMLGGETATGAWVAGAMLGFARSDTGFDATPTDSVSTGITGGVYASYVDGPLFIDSVLNINRMHYTVSAPQMGLDDHVNMRFDSRSIGGQVEAGRRISVASSFFVEPLIGLSYISTKFDGADVPGGGGGFDFGNKVTSLRFGGGARVGMKADLLGLVADYSLLARYWNESEARNQTTVFAAAGSSIDVTDAFDGQFNEVVAAVHLFGGEGMVSGFFNLGGKFGDDYQSIDGSVGVRVRW